MESQASAQPVTLLIDAVDDLLGEGGEPVAFASPAPRDPDAYSPVPALLEAPKLPNRFTNAQLKLVDRIHDNLIEATASRDQLMTALSLESSTKAQKFLSELLNPRNSKLSLSRIARKVGMDPLEIERIMRSHANSRALGTYIAAAPSIAKDVVADSLSHDDVCPRCEGLGKFKPSETAKRMKECPRCKGKGEIRVPGSPDARRLVYERIDPKARAGVNISLNVGQSSSTGSVLDDLDEFVPNNTPIIDLYPA